MCVVGSSHNCAAGPVYGNLFILCFASASLVSDVAIFLVRGELNFDKNKGSRSISYDGTRDPLAQVELQTFRLQNFEFIRIEWITKFELLMAFVAVFPMTLTYAKLGDKFFRTQ